MNHDKIDEILAKAGCKFEFLHGKDYEDFSPYMFAELLVLECMNVAKDPRWYSESPSNGWRNPINHVCKEIKEHFGVES